MSGLQTIIDNCNGLTIDRRKVVGIQITRNEIPRISETPTKNPWKFVLDIAKGFRYNEARDLMEAIDTLDRTRPQIIKFSNNPNFRWMFRYQGQLTTSQQLALIVSTFVGNQLVLTSLPPIASNRVLFQPNDLIQIRGYPYPFTVVDQVLRGVGSTVTVTTSRPNIITSSVAGLGFNIGNNCEFKMFCPNMPTYKLNVGGRQIVGGVNFGNAFVTFEDSFQLYEWVGEA